MTGLAPFYALHNNIASIRAAAFGDSTTHGNISDTNGGWVEQLRVLTAARWGKGGDGLHIFNRNWTFTTSTDAWTRSDSAQVWDSGPVLGAFGQSSTYMANGATKIATWTNPGGTTDSLTFFVVDGPTSANFAYSIDGGTNWINVAGTWTQNNAMRSIRVLAKVLNGGTVKVRGANAAGTAVNVYLVGLEPDYAGPGLNITNLGSSGEASFAVIRTTAGGWHSYLDLVQPPLCIFMFTNDVLSWAGSGPTDFSTRVDTFATQVESYGGCTLFINFFEQAGRSTTDQADLRARVKAVAASHGMPVIDFFDLVGNNAAAVAAGYMDAGDVHPNNAGCVFMAQTIWNVLAKSGVGSKLRP